MLQLPMLLFSSMMALQLVSDVSSNCCNIFSNNPTEFSSIDCSPLCHHIILISFLADLCLGHICSHKGFFGNTKDIRQRRSGHVFAHRRKRFFWQWKCSSRWKGWLYIDLCSNVSQSSCLQRSKLPGEQRLACFLAKEKKQESWRDL